MCDYNELVYDDLYAYAKRHRINPRAYDRHSLATQARADLYGEAGIDRAHVDTSEAEERVKNNLDMLLGACQDNGISCTDLRRSIEWQEWNALDLLIRRWIASDVAMIVLDSLIDEEV